MTDDIEEYLPELSTIFLADLDVLAGRMQEPGELWDAMRAGMNNLKLAAMAIYEADKSKQWTYSSTVKGPPNSRLNIGEGQTPDAQDVFNPLPQLPARQSTHTVQHRLGKGESGK